MSFYVYGLSKICLKWCAGSVLFFKILSLKLIMLPIVYLPWILFLDPFDLNHNLGGGLSRKSKFFLHTYKCTIFSLRCIHEDIWRSSSLEYM